MSDFHIVVFFNDYYTLIVAFLTNRYRTDTDTDVFPTLPDSGSVGSMKVSVFGVRFGLPS